MDARVRELVINGDTPSAERFMTVSRDRELEAEQFRKLQLLSCSRTLYAKVGFKMHVLIDGEPHRMEFPSTVARFNQSRDDNQSEVTDARLITKADVMLKREHLPSFDQMQKVGDAWLERNSGRLIDDACIIRTEARSFVSNVVTEGHGCTVLLEAQLPTPAFFCDATRFEFRIRETRGAPFDASTITLTGKQLTDAMNKIFQARRAVLAVIQKRLDEVGVDGQVHISPNQLLTAGNTFQMDLEPTDPRPSEAKLDRICVCWKDRRLALVSVTVAVGFVLVAPVALEPCPTCFDEIAEASTAWRCSQCKKHMHRECIDTWKSVCRTNGWQSSCPLCRAEEE